VTYMFILKCALKLVLKNILYYDARSEKHQIKTGVFGRMMYCTSCYIRRTILTRRSHTR